MNRGLRIARAAAALVGRGFRLHGRDPDTGLDCVGLVVCATRASGSPCVLPTGYRLRTGEWKDAGYWAVRNGFGDAPAPHAPGDILMVAPGPSQLHLVIVAEDPERVVEAHAGLRKVVFGPLPGAASVLRGWRLSPSP